MAEGTEILQKLDLLEAMRPQLEQSCAQDERSLVVDHLRSKGGQEFNIRIADPCMAVEKLDRQIEELKADMSGVAQ